jgi:hemerythrin-like metal-binding protein
MQPFEWTESCSVGIPELDAQHRQLIEFLAELRRSAHLDAAATLAPAALQGVVDYAERHLQREELVLRVRGYPAYLDHKAEHDLYRQRVASLQVQAGRRDLAIKIANFLTEWWRSHILTSDQQYARYFQCQPKDP